jgi:hypothetical protein
MDIKTIKIKKVDTEKLIEFLAIPLNENEKLSIDVFGVFENKFGIDTDCCFWEINQAFFNEKIQDVIDIECRIKKYNDKGGYSIRMDKADFVKTISLEDYLKLSEEVMLVDFIRLDYNPRITGNQKLLMKHIRQSYAVPTA